MTARYPIILAHGIAPFDLWSPLLGSALGPVAEQWDYFKGVIGQLERHGYRSFHSTVPFAARLADRARVLRAEVSRILNATGSDKVHVIGHSMGGLDARCMAVHFPDIANHIASITTIGTPHEGTPVADWWHLNRESAPVSSLLRDLKPILDLEGFKDLTVTACAQNNREWREQEAAHRIPFQTYGSWENVEAIFPPLRYSWRIIAESGNTMKDKRNDGLVPFSSQQWSAPPKAIVRKQFGFPADHLNQIGWWDIGEWSNGNWLPANFEEKVRNLYVRIAGSLDSLST